MKKWEEAAIVELDIRSTMKGDYSPTDFDDDLYDENGQKIGRKYGLPTASGPSNDVTHYPNG